MNREEIIQLAHEAGTTFVTQYGVASATPEWLERFARAIEATVLKKQLQQEPVARTVVEVGDWISNGDGTWLFRGQLISTVPLPDNAPLYASPVPAT